MRPLVAHLGTAVTMYREMGTGFWLQQTKEPGRIP
jgi:hypothetical protein